MEDRSTETAPPDRELAGGGQMGALMRSIDWSETPLGPVQRWPQSLRTAVSMMLDSRFAMVVAWGQESLFLYNDRYRPVLGASKHPGALGHPAREIFPEVWDFIGPLFRQALQGDAVALDDVLIPLDRNGYLEECFFTLSYSPIRDESGGVGGMLAVVAETTPRVQGERRLRTLRDLASRAAEAKTAEEACENAAEMLSQNGADVPFALLYLVEDDGAWARLLASTGLERDPRVTPARIDLTDGDGGWALGEAARSGSHLVLSDLKQRFGRLPGGAYPEPTHTAVVLPMTRPGHAHPYGFFIAGISPRRALDDKYQGFLDLATAHIVTAIGNARAYQEERERAEALAEIDRAKTAFFNNISHEFRTPLTLMLGPAEDLLSGRQGALPQPVRKQVDLVHRNGLRLLKLVNTLLDFARIEAGRLEATYEPTDLARLTCDLASSFRAAIERAGVKLWVACQPPADPVYVDRDMWEKIVLNLLSNAFKFTFEGEITVTLAQIGPCVELEIRDTGVGILAAELPNMFKRFHRIPTTRARTQEGSGIGLAMVHELVRMHGGTIDVSSEPGRGTSFRVVIPTGTAHLPHERLGAPRSREVSTAGTAPFVEEALRWFSDDASGGQVDLDIEPSVGLSGPSEAGPQGRILVVDDNADLRAYLDRLLSQRWTVELAADGAAALAAVERHLPDLILTDVMMPGLDGFELLRRLRSDPRTRSLPIIMLSARAGEEARVDGLDGGADDYLVKPFSARELMARVRAHLEMARLRAEMSTERARLHESARRREAELQTFIESSNALIFAKDLEGRHLLMNRPFELLAGRPRSDILGRTDEDLFDSQLSAAFQADDRRVLESGVPMQFERSFVHNGGLRHFLVVKFPLRDDSGQAYAVGCIATDITEQEEVQARLLHESRVNETLYRLGASFAKELDEEKLVQLVTDEATKLTGADFGSFFFNVKDDKGEAFMLYTISGASKDDFKGFALPRATPLFGPTYRGEGIIRLDDVRKDPRFGRWGPQPKGHLPVVSYLAVPVITRAGEVLGGLFFAHHEAGRFSQQHADIVGSLAGHAAFALENARLYSALRKSQETVRAAYEHATEADRRKDEFLAMLGHELRNPLAPIFTALQLIRMRGETRAERELQVIDRQVHHLSLLVDDLLDISRITRGKIDLNREPMELSKAVARAIEMASPLIEQRRHVLTVTVPMTNLRVSADPFRLAQVLSNLLTNAAKYTEPGGQIEVAASRDSGGIVLRVRDSGVGIPAELLPSIFDLFVQGVRSIDRSQGGLGIGLSLVRSLVELHGGTVSAHSEGHGKGSEFVVHLPALMEEVPSPPEKENDRREPSSAAGGRRILIVDDNVDAAEMMAAALREVGNQVEVAHDPAQALSRARGLRPEVALLDIGLPVMDGYELGRRLRELAQGARLQLIAVTGYGQESDRKLSVEAGFDGHLVKPVRFDALLSAVTLGRAEGPSATADPQRP
jgi:PAS domain S-box-containing protein